MILVVERVNSAETGLMVYAYFLYTIETKFALRRHGFLVEFRHLGQIGTRMGAMKGSGSTDCGRMPYLPRTPKRA